MFKRKREKNKEEKKTRNLTKKREERKRVRKSNVPSFGCLLKKGERKTFPLAPHENTFWLIWAESSKNHLTKRNKGCKHYKEINLVKFN